MEVTDGCTPPHTHTADGTCILFPYGCCVRKSVFFLQYTVWSSEAEGGLSRENREVEEDVLNHDPCSGTTYEAGENKGIGWEMVELPSSKTSS